MKLSKTKLNCNVQYDNIDNMIKYISHFMFIISQNSQQANRYYFIQYAIANQRSLENMQQKVIVNIQCTIE